MGRRKSLKRVHPLLFVFLLALGTTAGRAAPQVQTTCCNPSGTQTAASAPLDQRALDLLAETSNRLAAAETLAFKAVVTDERPNFPTAPFMYRTTSDVLLKRPDKLRVITSGAGPFSDFYYDGRMITEFSPSTNFSTATTAPPTIDEALKAVYNSAQIYFPFTEIISPGQDESSSECFENAAYLGQTRTFDGTRTDLIAYTVNGIFVQLWIGVEDKLPHMMLAVRRDDPLQLRHQLEFSNWQIDQPVSAEAFNVNDAIIAAQEPILPSGSELPMMNAPMIPAR
jgi:hypothetical protein